MMKNKEMSGIFNFLQRVSMSKVEPKALRNRLISLHLSLRKEIVAVDKKVNDLHKQFFGDKFERMKAYAALADSVNLAKTVAERDAIVAKLNGEYTEEQKADKEFGEARDAIMDSESKLPEFKRFGIDEFIATMTKVGIDVTGRDLTNLYPILEEK